MRKKCKLSELCDVRDGTHDSPEYVQEGYPLVTSKNIVDGRLDLTVVNYISEKDYNHINERSKVDLGDIIMPMIGTIGNPHLIEAIPEFAIKNVALIKFPKSDVSNKFIYYFLQSDAFKTYVAENNRGGTQKFLSLKDIRNMDIPALSYEKQLEICAVLDKVSELIGLRKEQLAKLDQLVKSRFIELFGLPVSNSKRWNTEKMREVAPAVNYSGGFEDTVWLLNLDMVEAQTGRILDYLYVNEEEVGNSTCAFNTTNVLYSKLRPYLNKVVIPDRCGYATSELIPLKPNPMKLERTYLAFMLRSDEFVNMINEKVAGAKMPRVSMSDFREFDVPVPPMELQKQFDAFVEQTDKSKLAIQQSLDKLELLKKSLMQEHFK